MGQHLPTACWAANRRTHTLYTLITSVEVEESMDMPAAIQITMPISRSNGGDLTYVADPRFAPLAPVAVVATAGGSGAAGVATGAVGRGGLGGRRRLGAVRRPVHLRRLRAVAEAPSRDRRHQLHDHGLGPGRLLADEPDREGAGMGRRHRCRRRRLDLRRLRHHARPTENTQDDSPVAHRRHPQPDAARLGHRLPAHAGPAQRQVLPHRLRRQARRSAPATSPSRSSTAIRRSPSTLNDPTNWTVSALDLEWDATRPTAVTARTALFSDTDPNGAIGDTTNSGLTALGDRDLADLRRPADDGDAGDRGRQRRRADRSARKALLREAGWFVRCEGEADADRLGVVLRAGMLVALAGIGALHSGTWIVWTVRHTAHAGGAQDALHAAAQRRGQPADRRLPAASPRLAGAA